MTDENKKPDPPADRRVHLWPLPGVSIEDVPAVELLVDKEVADELAHFQPPAFARSKPDGYAASEGTEPLEWQPSDVWLARARSYRKPNEASAQPEAE